MNAESPEFKLAVFDALCACLGLEKNSAAAADLIREAYTEPENTPRLPRGRNVVYWTVLRDPASDPAAVTEGDGPAVSMTLKYQLILVCYGPDCEKNALRIRAMLFPDGAGFPRRILRQAGIYPVPDPPQPSVLYEEEASLWRKRADLVVSLRVREEQTAPPRGIIQTAPAVIIRR
jgi:hypothetical protein